jgi:microcystin-dependent protein
MEAYLGSITMFAGNFAPRGWAMCEGQILSIAQNTALFSLLGTTYGGNGQTTFALPDLRGRVPVHPGQGPGLPNVALGESAGSPTVTLTTSQMPMHNHSVAANESATTTDPRGGVPANDARGTPVSIYANQSDGTLMNPQMIGLAGGNQPFSIEQPYLGINFIICMEGIYPSRN